MLVKYFANRAVGGHLAHQVRQYTHRAATQHLRDLTDEYVAGVWGAPSPVFTRAQGVHIWDTEGRQYTDFLAAYSALNQGHNHPYIVDAAIQQMTNGITATSRAVYHDQLGPWGEKICTMAGKERVMPMNTGAEAVETAIKAASRWGKLNKDLAEHEGFIVFAQGNFHGRTTTIIGASDVEEQRGGFGPYANGRYLKVPFNDIRALERLFENHGDKISAYVVEPIQGEGGIIVPSAEYLTQVQRLCKKHNVLLVVDEVQTGLGRTGKMFGYQHSPDVNPDIIIFGKAAGGGIVPVSGILANNDVMRVFTPGSHGSTFAGGPMQCAVGIASLEVIEQEGLVERSAELGDYFKQILRDELSPFLQEGGMLRDIRGQGLFLGIEFNGSAKPAQTRLIEEGFLCKATRGEHAPDGVLRLAPPLIIGKQELERFTTTFKSIVAEVEQTKGPEKKEKAEEASTPTLTPNRFQDMLEMERQRRQYHSSGRDFE